MSIVDGMSRVGDIVGIAIDGAVLPRRAHARSSSLLLVLPRLLPSRLLDLPFVRIIVVFALELALAHRDDDVATNAIATEGDGGVRDIPNVVRDRWWWRGGRTIVGRFVDGGRGGIEALDTLVVV